MKTLRTGIIAAAFASLLAGAAVPSAAQAADAERGKVLYETRCNACHESSVHNRSARKAKSFASLRAQVLRWSEQVGGSWNAEEIDAVTLYLNQRYYRFPCPQSLCKADQAALTR
ncbi:MAG: cytochrome C [Burkholderiales bacterium]|jgi:mono/diheme cytochrome c family protein